MADKRDTASSNVSKQVKKEPEYSDVTTTKDLVIRAAVLGVIACGISFYLFQWADFLRLERSHTRNLWIPEYQFFPGTEGPHETFLKYDYPEHFEILKVLGLGTLNIFFYSMFLCDALTLLLPKSLQYLDMLPFLLALVDFFENLAYFYVLLNFPERTPISPFVGYLTAGKHLLGAFIVGLIAFSGVAFAIRRITSGTAKPKSQ